MFLMSKIWRLPVSSRGWEDVVFRTFLGVSLGIHIIITVSMILTARRYEKILPKKLEIIYEASAGSEVTEQKAETVIKNIKSQSESLRPEILSARKGEPASLLPEELARQSTGLSFPQKMSSKEMALSSKASVSIPVLQAEKITNSKYMNYNERIRQKIKNRAYFYIDDPDFQEGEVYLTFVLLSTGELKEVQILDDKTRANDYLRGVGLRSIKESVPYPPFPSDLQYPELTFNVVISFTMSDVPESP